MISLVACGVFIAFACTLSNVSSVVLALAAAIIAVAAVVALVAAAIWSRPIAQSTFSVVVATGLGAIVAVRLFGTPAIGVEYESKPGFAFVHAVDPNGTLAQAGVRAPVFVQAIDGVEIGLGKAELASVIGRKRVGDRIRVTAWSGEFLPRTFDVVVGDK